MATFEPRHGGVIHSDVEQTLSKITLKSRNESDDVIDSQKIGSRFNQWRKPVADYGNNPPEWEVKLKSTDYVGDIEFSRKDWKQSRVVVDDVLKRLFDETKTIVDNDFEGLKIERYVRQGSSREGIKVIAPDEFDTILQFHFENLSFNPKELKKDGRNVNEFCYLEVKQSMATLQTQLPQLHKKGAFSEHNGGVVINARAMHTAVFGSIIDQALLKVMKKVKEDSSSVDFNQLKRKINPPSINITIELNGNVSGHSQGHGPAEIDLDIVPGLVIGQEVVPDPSRPGQTMDCPVYAVFKWAEESSMKAEDFPKADIVWRRSSTGIETHTLDLARFDRRQLYIITAMRILKTYFVKTRNMSRTPPQITTVFKSYHLKQFAFYVILYTCYIYTDAKICGVEDALLYFFALMRISLEKKSLPDFFHSNNFVTRMYPDYPTDTNRLRFNLLRYKSSDAVKQALLSLDNHLLPNLGFTHQGKLNYVLEKTKQEYSHRVAAGIFF